MTAADLLAELTNRGIRLEAVGDRISVAPRRLVTVQDVDAVLAHKTDLLSLLRRPPVDECNRNTTPATVPGKPWRSGEFPPDWFDDTLASYPPPRPLPPTRPITTPQPETLPADCRPWIHTARQILAGEFIGADRATREALIIGLESIAHPICRKALAILKP